MPQETLKRQPIGFLCLAILLVFSAHALPAWLSAMAKHFHWPLRDSLGASNFEPAALLLFSMMLVCHDPAGYGLRVGDDMRKKWPWVFLICIVPILVTAICYPLLPYKPYSGSPIATWLISPLAEDLLFAGFLYHGFSVYFPGAVGKGIPVNRCVFLTAACFSLAHLPNIAWVGSYIWFQLVYTFLGACLVGIIRQWTGSIIYITAVHMAVNFIAVHS